MKDPNTIQSPKLYKENGFTERRVLHKELIDTLMQREPSRLIDRKSRKEEGKEKSASLLFQSGGITELVVEIV